MAYQATIGLEVHVELKTKTKMFCANLNDPEETHPNTHICPVCVGHPGTLPVPNKKAIEEVKKKGITPFCITIDIEAKEYLPYLFGRNSYALIRDAKKLPKVLPEIYMNLTK